MTFNCMTFDEDIDDIPPIRDIDDERSELWKRRYREGYVRAFSAFCLYPRIKDEEGQEEIRIGEHLFRFEDLIDALAVRYANFFY